MWQKRSIPSSLCPHKDGRRWVDSTLSTCVSSEILRLHRTIGVLLTNTRLCVEVYSCVGYVCVTLMNVWEQIPWGEWIFVCACVYAYVCVHACVRFVVSKIKMAQNNECRQWLRGWHMVFFCDIIFSNTTASALRCCQQLVHAAWSKRAWICFLFQFLYLVSFYCLIKAL